MSRLPFRSLPASYHRRSGRGVRLPPGFLAALPAGLYTGIMEYTGLAAGERERYLRQLLMDGWSEEIQCRLKDARVGIAGSGGLGSPVATYLAAAGIGTIVLVDDQRIELSNLNRQVMFDTSSIGVFKVERAAERLRALNPEVVVIPRTIRITERNADELWRDCDLLMDCLDNWDTRFILNRFCVDHGVPLVHGGVQAWWGQFMLVDPPDGACLGCVLKHGPAKDRPVPVIGAVVGAVGCLMAAMAVRRLTGSQESGDTDLHFLDTRTMKIDSATTRKRPDCPECGAAVRT